MLNLPTTFLFFFRTPHSHVLILCTDVMICLGYTSQAASHLLQKLRGNENLSSPSQAQTDSDFHQNMPFGIHARPLGNVVYFICSLNSSPHNLAQIEQALEKVICA